jgi:hypothetical protein
MDFAVIFAAALAFYSITLAPTITWGDSAAFARMVHGGPLEIGTAADHPLFIVVGRLLSMLPFELATLLNFEAAVFGALAVTMVYRCGRQLGTGRIAAATGAAALGVSHAFWFHAVVAEVYTANAFFLATTLSLLLDWKRSQRFGYLAAAAGTFAIGLTNHLVLAAVAPAVVVFVLTTQPRTFLTRRSVVWIGGIVAALVGCAMLVPAVAEPFRRLWVGPPSIWEYFRLDADLVPMAREAGYYVLFLIYQFPSISLLLGFAGLWTLLRNDRSVAVLLLLIVVVNAGIFIHHTAWPSAGSMKFVFYISDYVVFSILCAVGVHELLQRLARRLGPHRAQYAGIATLAAVSLLPPVIYATLPVAANRFGVDLIGARRLPYRDNQRYFLNPNKHGEDSANRYASEALHIVKPDAVLFADSTPYEVLRYLQYRRHVRLDVLLRSPHSYGDPVLVHWVFAGPHRRPTYLAALTADYDLRGLTGAYDLIPVGPVIEVRPRDDP